MKSLCFQLIQVSPRWNVLTYLVGERSMKHCLLGAATRGDVHSVGHQGACTGLVLPPCRGQRSQSGRADGYR